jgi:glycine/D-amino acid oxidase-like deaminating enzyme
VSKPIEKQIIILGGGCAGLWLLYHLCRSGYSAVLIDYKELGQFASTRNQSWLHTGALYAVNRDDILGDTKLLNIVDECRASSQITINFCTQFCPEAIYKGSECLFIFEKPDDAQKAQKNITLLGLTSQIVTRPQIEEMEPVLSPMTKLETGLITDDIAFNSYRILTTLARKAWECGGLFHFTTKNLISLNMTFSRSTGMWSVSDGTHTFKAPKIVCAGGALISRMLSRRLRRGAKCAETIPTLQKCLVAVVNRKICNRIISIRSQASQFLNLVPFEAGTTINAGGLDASASDFTDRQFPESTYRELAERMTYFVPGTLSPYSFGVHFYICQKVANIHPSFHTRHYFWFKEQADPFYYFYPGKFTLAPIAARKLIKELTGDLTKVTVRLQRSDAFDDNVARRPYWGTPSHIGHTKNEILVFDEIKG